MRMLALLLLACGPPKVSPQAHTPAIPGSAARGFESCTPLGQGFLCNEVYGMVTESASEHNNREMHHKTMDDTLEQTALGLDMPPEITHEVIDRRFSVDSLITTTRFPDNQTMVVYVGPEANRDDATLFVCGGRSDRVVDRCLDLSHALSLGQLPDHLRSVVPAPALLEQARECVEPPPTQTGLDECSAMAVWERLSAVSRDTPGTQQPI